MKRIDFDPVTRDSESSFRVDAKRRTRNLEIPGLVLTDHPGMTAEKKAARAALGTGGAARAL
jgi:hypothetical protein